MFDCNNQYGHAMREYLPTGGFKWLGLETTSPEFWTDFVLNMKDDSETGYFFEVDLQYPTELHDQYPLAPEHLVSNKDMLSDYQKTRTLKLEEKNYALHFRIKRSTSVTT